MKSVVIIGCGAAGMMAALAAAREGAQTTVLEMGRKPGRKLLLTGNSRCNLTTLDPDLCSRYQSLGDSSCSSFVRTVYEGFSVRDTLQLFEDCGLLTMTEHGSWVYPVTGRSESVLGVLLRELRRLKVRMKYNVEVTQISRQDGMWQVQTEGWSYPCDSVVIACGSRAVPSTGSNGSGYELCRGLGLDVTDILPALTAVSCRLEREDCLPYTPGMSTQSAAGGKKGRSAAPDPLALAAGTRASAAVSVYTDGVLTASERGQVQFTQTGISGIVVFNMSRYTVRALHEGKDVRIQLDLLPDVPLEKLTETLLRLHNLRPEDSMRDLLTGILAPGLIPLFENEPDCRRTAEHIKALELQALGHRDFDNCQVCAGGVRLTELYPRTMECVRSDLRGIHIAGELVDVDGPCGGYNLQWAWASGYVAGRHAAM